MLIAVGAIVLVTPAGAVLDQTGVSGPVTEPGSALPGLPEPQLTPDQESRARELLAIDDKAQKILGGESYQVQQIGPWGGDGGEPVTGAALILGLSQPISVEMQQWPVVDFQPAQDPPYEEHNVEMAASEVRELFVLVDLKASRVVVIDPHNPQAEITPSPELRQKVEAAAQEAAPVD